MKLYLNIITILLINSCSKNNAQHNPAKPSYEDFWDQKKLIYNPYEVYNLEEGSLKTSLSGYYINHFKFRSELDLIDECSLQYKLNSIKLYPEDKNTLKGSLVADNSNCYGEYLTSIGGKPLTEPEQTLKISVKVTCPYDIYKFEGYSFSEFFDFNHGCGLSYWAEYESQDDTYYPSMVWTLTEKNNLIISYGKYGGDTCFNNEDNDKIYLSEGCSYTSKLTYDRAVYKTDAGVVKEYSKPINLGTYFSTTNRYLEIDKKAPFDSFYSYGKILFRLNNWSGYVGYWDSYKTNPYFEAADGDSFVNGLIFPFIIE